MFSDEVKKEIIHFAAGTAVLGVIMEIIIFAFWHGSESLIPMLAGTVYGCVYVIFNFAYTGYSVSKSVDKSENKAKLHMQLSYMIRMGLLIAVVLSAVFLPKIFNVYTVVIPLLFTRIIIMFNTQVLNRKKKKDGDIK